MEMEKVTSYIKSGKRAYFTQMFINSARDVKVIWKRNDGKADLFEYKGQLFKYKASAKADIYYILEAMETEVAVPKKKRRVR